VAVEEACPRDGVSIASDEAIGVVGAVVVGVDVVFVAVAIFVIVVFLILCLVLDLALCVLSLLGILSFLSRQVLIVDHTVVHCLALVRGYFAASETEVVDADIAYVFVDVVVAVVQARSVALAVASVLVVGVVGGVAVDNELVFEVFASVFAVVGVPAFCRVPFWFDASISYLTSRTRGSLAG